MIPTENMRSLDTSTLVTLKQRIERELMRRGDVEQEIGSGSHGVNAAAAEIAVGIAELAKSAGVSVSDVDAAIAADREAQQLIELTHQLDAACDNLMAAVENPDAYMDGPSAGDTRLHILPEAQAIIDALPATQAPIAQRRFLREPDRSCGMCSGRGIKPSDDWEPGSRTVLRLCPCLWGGE